MPAKLWYIRGLELHRGAEGLIRSIRDLGRMERWGHRADISHREQPDEVYVVLQGFVDLHDGANAGEPRLRPGDLFGDTGNEARKTILRAYDDTVIAGLDRSIFEDIALESLGALQTQVGLVRRRELEVPVSALLYTTPQRRIPRVLLHLVEDYGQVDEDRGILDVTLRDRNLARLSGLADHSVSAIFDAMKRDRLVEVGKTELVIPSLGRMRELAIGEP